MDSSNDKIASNVKRFILGIQNISGFRVVCTLLLQQEDIGRVIMCAQLVQPAKNVQTFAGKCCCW